MKKGYLFLLLAVFSFKGEAQIQYNFADSTSEWTVLSGWWDVSIGEARLSRIFYTYGGDTTVNSQEYQIINGNYPFYTRFIRMDSLYRVWMVFPEDTIDYPLYDFQRLPGDTFYTTIDDPQYTLDSVVVTVDSVDSVYLGKWRKRMFVHGQVLAFQSQKNDVIIEGIGSLGGYLFGPIDNPISTDDVAFTFLCYNEGGQLLYVNPSYNTCILGVENMGIGNNLQVSPNPSFTSFTLQLSSPPTNQTHFLLFDALGRQVKREEIVSETTTIHRDNLPSGIYFWQLQAGNKILDRGKLVME